MRFGLQEKKGKPKQLKIAVFDIEASNWIDFKILGFYDGKMYKEFYTVETFLDFVLRKKYRDYKIYAHNGGRYDFRFLLPALTGRNKSSIIEVNGSLLQMRIHLYSRHYITFRDSFALLPKSLDSLSLAFNVKHKKQKIDNYNFDEITKEKREYLKYDCFSLYEVITAFQTKINSLGAELKLTVASTSLDLFTRKYFPKSLPYIANYPRHENKIKSGYYGGRTEVFRRYYKGNLYCYDYNSLYPAVMENNFFPVGNPIYVKSYRYNKNDYGFMNIETVIPKTFVPLLPVRSDNMLQFPTGKVRGWYPMPFLQTLEKLNIAFKINEAVLFNKRKIFKDFVNDLYKIKVENKGNALYYITKLMMNGIYGKFAQNVKRQEFIQNPKVNELVGLINYDMDLNLFYRIKEVRTTYILPALSAYVTAYAQLKLFDLLHQYQDSLFYCDTDSIYTSEKLPESEKLGDLKLEHEIKEAIFLTQKVYCFIDKNNKFHYKCKGFSKAFSGEFVYSDFYNALFKNDLSGFKREFFALYGLKESLNRYEKTLVFDKKKKSLKNLETKRRFTENFLTKPLHFQ